MEEPRAIRAIKIKLISIYFFAFLFIELKLKKEEEKHNKTHTHGGGDGGGGDCGGDDGMMSGRSGIFVYCGAPSFNKLNFQLFSFRFNER